MTRQEKLAVLLVVLAVLERAAHFVLEVAVASVYGPAGPIGPDKMLVDNVAVGIAALVNLGAAVWLYVEAKAASLRTWCWPLFGLVFGLLGVVAFYGAQLYAAAALPRKAKMVETPVSG